ncbi:MAG: hypothetical protein U1E76_15020 [Planctomycetota bacterium]
MGLEEKRAIKAAQDGWLEQRKREIVELTGASIPYEIDWNTFADDLKGVNWLEHNGPQQIAIALRQICVDELGKQAVQEAVKKIVIRNVKSPSQKSVAFANGMLELSGNFAEGIAGTVREREIKECLLKGL